MAANWDLEVKVGSGDLDNCLSLSVAAECTAYLSIGAGLNQNIKLAAILIPLRRHLSPRRRS